MRESIEPCLAPEGSNAETPRQPVLTSDGSSASLDEQRRLKRGLADDNRRMLCSAVARMSFGNFTALDDTLTGSGHVASGPWWRSDM